MGKKSLIKSTTKKTSGAKEAEEKTTKKPATKTSKKAAPKSTKKTAAKTTKKTAPKKAAAKKTTKAKPKAAPKKTAPKKTKAAKKVSIKDLVFKKFEATQPAPKPIASPKPAVSDISAPPLIDSTDPKEVERMRGLLFNKFTMDEIKAAAKAPAPSKPETAPKKAKPRKKLTAQELLFMKFEPLQPLQAPMAPLETVVSVASAPPFIDSTDPKEVERIRALLFNKFSMDEIKAVAKEPEPLPEPAPALKDEPESAPVPKDEPESAPAPKVEAEPAPAPKVEAEPAPAPKVEPAPSASAAKPAPVTPEPTVSQPAEHEAYITLEDNDQNGGKEPMSLPVKIAIAAAVTFVFLLLAISYNNGSKYYIQPKENAIEIWKGCFSPKDTKLFMTLNDVQLSEPVKEIYTKAEVFPLILNFYIEKADSLLEAPGLPDFKEIKDYLHQAEEFIVTEEMEAAVTSRLNNIERMSLLYKADVAMSKNTEDSLESAINMLKEAAKITSSAAMSEEISQKIETAREQAASLKAAPEQSAEDMQPPPEQSAEDMEPAPEQSAKE